MTEQLKLCELPELAIFLNDQFRILTNELTDRSRHVNSKLEVLASIGANTTSLVHAVQRLSDRLVFLAAETNDSKALLSNVVAQLALATDQLGLLTTLFKARQNPLLAGHFDYQDLPP